MKLLVIEKDPMLLARIIRHFRKEDFFCDNADTYDQALLKIENFQYDCIILDPHLPDGDGLKLIGYLRADTQKAGAIVISSLDSPDAKITALDHGADDYMTKPIDLPELGARVKALLRRKYNQGRSIIQVDSLRIDLDAHTVSSGGNLLPLRKREFHLFLFLAMNRNHIVPLQAIAEHLFDGPSEKTPPPDFIYVHIKNLKRKLRDIGYPELIRSVYGMGYILTA